MLTKCKFEQLFLIFFENIVLNLIYDLKTLNVLITVYQNRHNCKTQLLKMRHHHTSLQKMKVYINLTGTYTVFKVELSLPLIFSV